MSFGMDVIIYGLVGHAGSIRMPLDRLELDDLATGREFEYRGKVYEIRSITENGDSIMMNVIMILDNT